MASLNIKGLTVGESLLIARRRSFESQETVSRRLGLTRNLYGRLERDNEEEISSIKPPEISELSQEEICLLMRRRAGLTQEDCAAKMGKTRFWFNQMETGRVCSSELIKFWGGEI